MTLILFLERLSSCLEQALEPHKAVLRIEEPLGGGVPSPLVLRVSSFSDLQEVEKYYVAKSGVLLWS